MVTHSRDGGIQQDPRHHLHPPHHGWSLPPGHMFVVNATVRQYFRIDVRNSAYNPAPGQAHDGLVPMTTLMTMMSHLRVFDSTQTPTPRPTPGLPVFGKHIDTWFQSESRCSVSWLRFGTAIVAHTMRPWHTKALIIRPEPRVEGLDGGRKTISRAQLGPLARRPPDGA